MKKIITFLCIITCIYGNGKIANPSKISDSCKEYAHKKLEGSPMKYEEIVTTLKGLGVSYYFGFDVSNVRIFKIAYLCVAFPQLDEAVNEVKQYMNKKVKEDFIYAVGRISVWDVDKALMIYNSKEYGQEVERIVKKYCKDCK